MSEHDSGERFCVIAPTACDRWWYDSAGAAAEHATHLIRNAPAHKRGKLFVVKVVAVVDIVDPPVVTRTVLPEDAPLVRPVYMSR